MVRAGRRQFRVSYLPLSGKVPVPGRDTQKPAVVLLEGSRVVEDGHVRRLGRGVHLAEDLIGESLGDPRLAKGVNRAVSCCRRAEPEHAAWHRNGKGEARMRLSRHMRRQSRELRCHSCAFGKRFRGAFRGAGPHRAPIGETHWYTSTVPPAFLMPRTSASARALMWPYIEYCGRNEHVSLGLSQFSPAEQY